MKTELSVIVAVYNEERDIENCILSLNNQTKKHEIIVVDDGSTDSTQQKVKQYKNIKFLTQSHFGPGIARNFGAKAAKGKIIIFVDADMTFEADFLEKLTLPIKAKRAIGTYSQEEYVANWDNPWARCWNWNNNAPDQLRVRPNRHDQEDFRAILTSEFVRVGGFDATGYTDSRTLVKKLGVFPVPAPGAIYYHRNPDNLKEVFIQSRWIGRRKMRFGLLGQIYNLVRHSLPLSIIIGMVKSIETREIRFLIFKLAYDTAFSLGIISSLVNHKTSR